MPDTLEVVVEENAVTVVRVRGEVDILTAPALRTRLADAARRGRDLVVDLTEAEFFDASGLRVLDQVAALAREHGTRLALVAPERSSIRRLLNIVRLDERIQVCDSVAAATAFLMEDPRGN